MRKKKSGGVLDSDPFQRLFLSAKTHGAAKGELADVVVEYSRDKKQISCRLPVDVETESGYRFTAQTVYLSEAGMQLEYEPDKYGEFVGPGDNLQVVLTSPFLATSNVRVKEVFRVSECIPVDGSVWRISLQTEEHSKQDSVNGLSEIRPHAYVMPPVLEEQFVKTKAQINFQLPDAGSKILVFSGVESGAGSSTISWWFASCLARTPERRVLLVDGNLRPNVDAGDVRSSMPGFVDILLGRETLDNTVVDLGSGAPHLLSAGRVNKLTSSEMSASDLRVTYEALRQRYDYVIIDALPTRESPITLMWARDADGCLLVLESKKTERDKARASVASLRRAGARILGAVLNKA